MEALEVAATEQMQHQSRCSLCVTSLSCKVHLTPQDRSTAAERLSIRRCKLRRTEPGPRLSDPDSTQLALNLRGRELAQRGLHRLIEASHAKLGRRGFRPEAAVAFIEDIRDVCGHARFKPVGLERCSSDMLDELCRDLGCCLPRDCVRELQQTTAAND